jgi:hypothetical protein
MLPQMETYYIGNLGSTNRVRMITTHVTDVTSAIENETGFSIYPNPAHKTLYVERTGTGKCSISMTDMCGREVYTDNMNHHSTIATIDVGELASGIYTVQVTDKAGIIFTQSITIR